MLSRFIDAARRSQCRDPVTVLTLREVSNHPDGAAALDELRCIYVISEVADGLLLSHRDGNLRLFLYDLKTVLGAARREREARSRCASQPTGKFYRTEDLAFGATDLASARQVIGQLEARIEQIRINRKEVSEQREQWRWRAMRAEERLKTSGAAASHAADMRYLTLRRFLARQLHPDHAPGDEIQKTIRNEIFKEIWAEIARIDTADQ